MPTIDVSEETLEALRARVKDFGESPESVIRRLLGPAGGETGKQQTAVADQLEVAPELKELTGSGHFQHLNGRDRYFALLKVLHDTKSELFATKVPGLKFGKRIQIARTFKEIDESGKSTFPEQIPETNFWALTNLSNRSKRDTILAVMQRLDYPEKDIRFALQTIPDSSSNRSSAAIALLNQL